MKRSDLVLSLGQRLLLLLFIFIVCYGITSVAVYLLSRALAGNMPAALRIGAVLQDVFSFIVPAVATALIVTRKSAELLKVAVAPRLKYIGLLIAMLFLSIPIQENIIYWNYHITLPESLAGFGRWARELEDAGFSTMSVLLGNPSVGALIVNLLIIGFAAGFSEELLFRGCFQQLLTTGGVNRHVADRGLRVQRHALPVLRLRAPYAAWRLFRLSAYLDWQPVGARNRPYAQQYDVRAGGVASGP